MNKKKGFTLVELLAVIAILAILVIIALPNILELFNKGKKQAFETEIRTIYNVALSQDAFTSGDKLFTTGDLDVSVNSDIEYSIFRNNAGRISCYEIRNSEYMYIYRVIDGHYAKGIEEIGNSSDFSPVDSNYVIDCSTTGNFDDRIAGTLAPHGTWWRGVTDPSKIERIVVTNKYTEKEYDESFFSDKENVGGIITYVNNNIAYIVNNRHKRLNEAFKMPSDSAYTFSSFKNLKNLSGLKLMDFSGVENINNFFGDESAGNSCTKLNYINGYENWNVSNIKSAQYAFANTALSTINLSNWNITNLNDATGMFYGTKANEIILSGWNTSNVTSFKNMFSNCNAREILLGGWNTSISANYINMFSNCSNLNIIGVTNSFNVPSDDIVMFKNDNKLMGGKGTLYSTDKSKYARLDSDDEPGYFASVTSDGIMTAKLYDSGSVSGSGTYLTAEGSIPNDWNFYSGARLLEVKLYAMEKGKTKTVDITVPTGMYIVNNSWTKANSNIKSVSFETLDNQDTGKYKNNNTGTLKYTIAENTTNLTLQCLVMFDTAIWDKNKKDTAAGTTNMTRTYPVVVNYNNGSTIKRIGNIASSNSVGNSTVGYSFYTNNVNNNIYVGEPITLLASNSFLSTDQSTVPYFYKSIDFESIATSTDSAGNTIYAQVNKATNGNIGEPNSKSFVDGVYSAHWDNSYVTSGVSFPRLEYYLPEGSGFVEGKKLRVNLKTTVVTYSGQSKTLTKAIDYTIKSKDLNKNDISLGRNDHSSPSESYYGDSGYVDILGAFTFTNSGYNDFDNLKLTYTYDSETSSGTPKMKVTAARVAAENKQTITMKVLLQDANGNKYGPYNFTGTGSSNTAGIYVSANYVAKNNSLSGNYYIKEINYTLPKITGTKNTSNKGTNYLYGSQGSNSPSSAGVFFGTLTSSAKSIFKVEFEDGTNKTVTSTSSVTNTPSYSGYINSIATPLGNDFTAGSDIELAINIASVSYPYTHTQAFSNPEVYIILPFGVNINSVLIGNSKTITATDAQPIVTKMKDIIIDDVLNIVYRITFKDPVWFGYLYTNDTSTSAGPAASKWVRVKLSTENTMEFTSINLRENVYFKDRNGHISIGGSYAKYSISDKFDVDNDGSYTDKYGAIIETNKIINIYGAEE